MKYLGYVLGIIGSLILGYQLGILISVSIIFVSTGLAIIAREDARDNLLYTLDLIKEHLTKGVKQKETKE